MSRLRQRGRAVALRFLNATGEALTALILIAGGVFAYGYLPTL